MHFQKFEEKYIDDVVALSDKNLGKNFKTREQYLDIHRSRADGLCSDVTQDRSMYLGPLQSIEPHGVDLAGASSLQFFQSAFLFECIMH